MSATSVLDRAAAGALPDWAEASPERRAHMDRVAGLMSEWALGLGLDDSDRIRWTAAGRLHDAFRDASVQSMLPWVPAEFADLPGSFLHGPAAAARLQADGVDDADVLNAIRYHTLGSHELATLGRALIAADFLEPGRESLSDWRARQRARMPADLDGVLVDVVAAKLAHGLDSRAPLRPEMVRLWNALVDP